MTTPYPRLFSPGTIGRVELRNRIVQTPMGTGLIDLGRVTEREVAFQEERARAGVGLLVTGGAVVHPTSRFPARIIVEAWDEAGVEALRLRCDAVHRHGTRIFGQLIHLGRETPGGQTDYVPMGPSPVPHQRDPGVPHEMTSAEIRMVVDAFGRSAANHEAAGYDGVEIHAAHGYLVSQFLSPESNRRTDGYGGTLEGRLRLLVEIVEEIRLRCGPDFPVGARLSAEDYVAGGLTLDDTREIAVTLQDAAPVDYLSITTGMRGYYVKDSTFDEGFALDLAQVVKADVDVPVVVAGRIRHPELAERALAEGKTDFVGIGRAQLADPEWVEKAREGRADQIRLCVGIVQDCRRAEGIVACTIHARTGREAEWGPARRAAPKRRVVVAGGGPGGLEAARVAAESGHEVVLHERTDVLGGQLRIAAAGPTREELLDFVFYLERELARLGVEIRLGSEAGPESVLADGPDLVVCAAGATPEPPELEIGGGARVVTVWDLLGGTVGDVGARALVVDDGSGFWHGISAAEYLAERGAAVELATPARGVGLAIPHESVANVNRRLGANGVRVRVLTSVLKVDGPVVSLAEGFAGELTETTADLVVVRTRMRANDELARRLEGAGPALALIGDASAPRRLNHAVLDANLAVRRFDEGRLGSAATALA
ncbi:MAG TPA: FAD-dependent oxidoreductase [Gaiellaceae bacterium]|jgi:2,4-dienoyl-CoA reductase (NADPH2)